MTPDEISEGMVELDVAFAVADAEYEQDLYALGHEDGLEDALEGWDPNPNEPVRTSYIEGYLAGYAQGMEKRQ